MGGFIESSNMVEHTVREGLFLTCISKLQRETIDLFKNEEEHEGASRDVEMKHLEQQQSFYTDKASEGLKVISQQVKKFERACSEMGKLTTNLEITRVMGRIEGSSVDTSMTNVNDLIEELGAFQEAVLKGLKDIHHTNQDIRFDVEQLLKASSKL